MLYKISHGEVDDYKDGQEPILHLVSTVERVVEGNLPFTFTNGHAEMKPIEFYERVRDLDNIDWELMESQFWFDTETDLNRKWRRQAEFLVHSLFPTNLLIGIAVISEDVKREVEQLVEECSQQIKVVMRPSYYYIN
jgi:hypothetical protein